MSKISLKKIADSFDKFKYITNDTVKFSEVDSCGVVHNVQYHYMVEWARILYMRDLGLKMSSKSFAKDRPMLMAHASIDFFSPGRFLDEYAVRTRVTFIKNSSIGFEHIIHLQGSNEILAWSECVIVNLNETTLKPERVPDEFRSLIRDFEGSDVLISD